MSRLIKQYELDTLRSTLKNTNDCVFLTAAGISAQAEYQLRTTLRKSKITLRLVKNSYGRKIFEERGIQVDGVWSGPTLIAWGSESLKQLSNTIAKTIEDMVKKEPKLKDKITPKSALADKVQCTFEQAKKMPTRQDAIADVLKSIISPAMNLAGCLVGPAGQVASQIEQIGNKKDAPA
jgi:ribosomal protein L10